VSSSWTAILTASLSERIGQSRLVSVIGARTPAGYAEIVMKAAIRT
jgi:hypothetical protein